MHIATWGIYDKLLVEDEEHGEESMSRKLLKAMCGAAEVAQNWQRESSENVRCLAFTMGKGRP